MVEPRDGQADTLSYCGISPPSYSGVFPPTPLCGAPAPFGTPTPDPLVHLIGKNLTCSVPALYMDARVHSPMDYAMHDMTITPPRPVLLARAPLLHPPFETPPPLPLPRTDVRVYGHFTTAMHEQIEYAPLPSRPTLTSAPAPRAPLQTMFTSLAYLIPKEDVAAVRSARHIFAAWTEKRYLGPRRKATHHNSGPRTCSVHIEQIRPLSIHIHGLYFSGKTDLWSIRSAWRTDRHVAGWEPDDPHDLTHVYFTNYLDRYSV